MPPQMDDGVFDALKIIVQELDFRAKRLTEWRELQRSIQLSEAVFDVFLAKYKSATDPPTTDQLKDLNSSWTDCDGYLIELDLLSDGFQAITKTLSDGAADPTVKTWIEEVIAAGKKVAYDLGKKSYVDLAMHTGEYKAAYIKLSIQREAKVTREVSQLATLTNELKLKFG